MAQNEYVVIVKLFLEMQDLNWTTINVFSVPT